MPNKIISNIDTSFIPTIIPKVKGRFALDRLQDEAFPMYTTIAKKGVDLIIRGGHPFLITYPYLILNTQFRQRFKTLLELTNKRNFTLHATMYAKGVSEEQLYSALVSPNKLLPNNTNLYITMCLYENSIEEMNFKNIVLLVKAFFGTENNPIMPNIIPATYSEVNSKEKLKDMAEFLLQNTSETEGLLLLNKKGSYIQGESALTKTNAVLLDPSEDIFGTIVKINSSTNFLPGETLTMADELLIKFGETELTYSLSSLSLVIRGFLVEIKNKLIGSKILCNNLYFTNQNTPTIKKIKKIYYL